MCGRSVALRSRLGRRDGLSVTFTAVVNTTWTVVLVIELPQ
jgi:hypothetical protein